MNTPAGDDFRQSELDKFGALAQRWWGEGVRLRVSRGHSRAAKRTRMDARAGSSRHGWLPRAWKE